MSCRIIIIRQTIWEHVVHDAIETAQLVSLVGIGVYLGSDVLQWIGAVIGILTLAGRFAHRTRFSISEARAELDRLEAEEALSGSLLGGRSRGGRP